MTNFELQRRREKIHKRRIRAAMIEKGLSTNPVRWGQPRLTERHWSVPDNVTGAARQRALERINRQRNALRGLRIDGKPLVRKRHNLPRATTREQLLANRRARFHSYSASNRANGLFWNGKPRVSLSAQETAWRELRSTIQVPESYDWLDFVTHGSQIALN